MKQPRNTVEARLSRLVAGKADVGATFQRLDPSNDPSNKKKDAAPEVSHSHYVSCV